MDEHDPYYESQPNPERRKSDAEVEVLRNEVEHLQKELTTIRTEVAANRRELKKWQESYTLGRGIFIGVFCFLGVFGFLMVDFVKDMIDHLYTTNNHHNGPP